VELTDDEMGMVLQGLASWAEILRESVENLRRPPIYTSSDLQIALGLEKLAEKYENLHNTLFAIRFMSRQGLLQKLCSTCNGPSDAEWHTQEAQDRKLEDDEPVGHAFQE
jgi:hypothetical protein